MAKNELTIQELETLLEEKKKEQKELEKKQRVEYESERDALVKELVEHAELLSGELKLFKTTAVKKLDEFSKKAKQYGDVRSNSKGGFGLRSSDKNLKVVYGRNTKSEYDERAAVAEQLLKEFLEDKVKKRDIKDYKTISALLSRNKSGDFNPVSINTLLSIDDNYDDQRWIKAMKLFKESYNNIFISMSIEFFRKDDQDKDVSIPMTFASL